MWTVFQPARRLGPVSGGFYEDHALSLGPSDIRLLRLHGGSSQDAEITCTLERRHLPRSRPTTTPKPDLDCTALSYMWGDATSNLRKIQCNGTDFFVTRNLYSALYYLRDPLSDTVLWIDAICINQNNPHEKGTQVGRMGEIYSRALHTIIWLGEASMLSREGMRACLAIASRSTPSPTAPAGVIPWRAPWWDPWALLPPFLLLLFLRRPYFTRIWVVQEAALSKDLQIACGPDRISWYDFSLGATTILEAGFGSRASAGIGNILVARSLLPSTAEIGLSEPANVFKTLTQQKVPQMRDILSLAILFRRSHATEPVDKLFGLLGLCEQIKAGGTYGIAPAYSQDDPSHKNRIYISTARRIIDAQGGLLLLSAVNRPLPSMLRSIVDRFRRIWLRESQGPALPTWVPDWSDSGNAAKPISLMLAQAHDIGAANTCPDIGYLREASPEDCSPYLSLSGYRLGNISILGEICNTEKAQSSIWFSIKYTFTMAENHRLEIFRKWYKRFRPRARTRDPSFGRKFIRTLTCGSKCEQDYHEASVGRLLDHFSTRSPRRLAPIPRTVAACLGILPLAICAITREGFLERVIIYWFSPVMVISFMWYMCFQLVPNFMFREGWSEFGVGPGFLQADFDSMELRRLAMLDCGALALVPQAAVIGDEVWRCKAAMVPLVLRHCGAGGDFEMVGECYLAELAATEQKGSAEVQIRLV